MTNSWVGTGDKSLETKKNISFVQFFYIHIEVNTILYSKEKCVVSYHFKIDLKFERVGAREW